MNLVVHVEGQTEEQFVDTLLAPHLSACGYSTVRAGFIGGKQGGITSWTVAQRDIVNHLEQDPECIATTMVDYYGLPATGASSWPGRTQASQLQFADKAPTIEDALLASVLHEMGPAFDGSRFVPYVMMHEFEALLFSDCDAFAHGISRPALNTDFQRIRDAFDSPEEIDDSPTTTPSKRIEALVPGYQKPLMGTLAAQEIGLQTMREECLHFGEWIARLEQLPAAIET